MTSSKTFNLTGNHNIPDVTETLLSDKASPNSYPLKEDKWVTPYFSLKRHQQHLRILKIQRKKWVPLLFCIFALVALLTSCYRAGRVGTLPFKFTNTKTNKGRRLANTGGQPANEDANYDEAKILEMCLDWEETAGIVTTPFPLSQKEAVPLILQFLYEPPLQQQPEAIQQAGGDSPFSLAPLIASTAPSSQPGPSSVGATAGWWGPFYSSYSQQQEAFFLQEAAGPLGQALQTPLPLFQTQQRQKKGPRESEPATSNWATAEKRRKTQWAPREPPPKKHISGWKREKPSSALGLAALSSSHQQQPVGLGDESIEEDPLFKAIQALKEGYSPPPLEIFEAVGESAEELDDSMLGPSGLVSVTSHLPSPQVKELPLTPSRETSSTISLSEEEEGESSTSSTISLSEGEEKESITSPTVLLSEREGEEEEMFCLNSPGPFISQKVGRALPAPPQEDSLPGPSEKSSSIATPLLLCNEESGDGQQQAAFPSSVSSPRTPAAPQRQPGTTHLFYRLPVLRPGHIMQTFIVNRAFYEAHARVRSHAYLNRMRFILAQPVITSTDAASLVAHSEIVAGRLLEELHKPFDAGRLSLAISHLGKIYLAMDALISAVEVLGPVMNADEWWPLIKKAISTKQLYFAGRTVNSVVQAALATDLSRALQSLRNRVRLPEKETVLLKRRLLCSRDTVAEFRLRRWDPWREDDEKSGGSGEI